MNNIDATNESIDEVGELLEVVSLGDDAKTFINTPLGRYMLNKARNQIVDNRAKLETVDPHDSRRIEKIQRQIEIARDVIEWLQEAISAGDAAWAQAEPLINQQDEGDER